MSQRLRRLVPSSLFPSLMLAFLLALVGTPIYRLASGAFREGTPFEPGRATLRHFQELLSTPGTLEIAGNSLTFALAQTLIALLVGVPFAFLVARTNLPLGGSWGIGLLALYFLPLLVGAIGWTLLLAPRSGFLNQILAATTGMGPIDVFSMGGMVWVQSLYLIPLVYIIVVPTMRAAGSDGIDAALIHGGGRLRCFFIVVGQVRPAIFAAGLLAIIIGFESIEVPLLFGQPKGIYVFSSDIYSALRVQFPANWGAATSRAIVLMVVAVALFLAYMVSIRQRYRYVSVVGKGRGEGLLNLGRFRHLAVFLIVVFFLVALVLPLLALAYVSLMPFVSTPSIEGLANASFENHRQVWGRPSLTTSIRNSAILSFSSAAVVVAVGLAIAFIGARSTSRLKRPIEILGLTPISIPRIVLAAALLWTLVRSPIRIYGTLAIIGIAYVVQFLPVASRQLLAAFLQVSPDLEHAARIAGSTSLGATLRITMPLVKGAIAAVLAVATISFLREFPASVLLYSTGTQTVSVAIFDLFRNGESVVMAAFAIQMTLALAVVLGLPTLLLRRRAKPRRV